MTWSINTAFCVDRNTYVREIVNDNGDLICELSHETIEKPQANKYESLILAAPEMLRVLEHFNNELIEDSYIKHSKDAIRKIKDILNKVKGA